MRNLFLMIFMGASLTGILPAEQKATELSGFWILDPGKSRVDQTTSALPRIRITGGVVTPTDSDTTRDNAPLTGHIIVQPQNLTLQIVHTADEVRVLRRFTAAGREHSIAQTFALDGSQCLNPASDGRGDFASRSEWKNGKLINSGAGAIVTDGPRIEVYIREEFSLSKNGKKLTIQTMHTTPQGITKLKQEFLRKDE
jgi:hypothetical protein